jgi:SAM-dependent methyltransferase
MCAVARRSTGLPFAAADMTALPVRSGSVAAILCWYAVIHLGDRRRPSAYAEFARVLRPGGHALLAFHTGDAETAPGGSRRLTEWWDHPVDLTSTSWTRTRRAGSSPRRASPSRPAWTAPRTRARNIPAVERICWSAGLPSRPRRT